MSARALLAVVIAPVAGAAALAGPAQAQPLPVHAVPAPVGAPISTSAPAAGTYVPLAAPTRVVDTGTGAGHNRRGALRAGHAFTATIAGRGQVPARGVGAVMVTLTAFRATAPGALVAYPRRRPHTANVQFAPGAAATDAAIVPLAAGRLTIASTAARGSVEVAVDVLGYYRSGTPATEAGTLHTVRPTRVLDTRHGRGPVRPHHSISVRVAGLAGVPAGAGAVAVTITAIGAGSDGAVLAGWPGAPVTPAVQFRRGKAASGFALLGVGGTSIRLVDESAGRVHLAVDVLGYVDAGVPAAAQASRALPAAPVASHALAARSALGVRVAGRAGVPQREVAAVLVTVRAGNPGAAGTLSAGRGGAPPARTAQVLSFGAHQPAADTVLLPVSPTGTIEVRNTSHGRVHVFVDVRGYVTGAAVPAPDGTATARYLDALQDRTTPGYLSTDEGLMSGYGCADAQNGVQFTLLDIGAQSITGPQLTKAHPGVLLALTSQTRLTYPDLRAVVQAYIDGYTGTCNHGTHLELALGTNNDGSFSGPTAYAATARGTDWAAQLIDPLATSVAGTQPGVTVVGAIDIEAQFASTEAQAQAWEDSYLQATGADLIENGDANQCPTTFGVTGARCAYGWTQQQYYALAHRGDRILALPQIFFPAEAVKWANIDATGGGQIDFLGSLTEHARVPAQLTPTQGRAALYRALSWAVFRPAVPFAADLLASG